jgi:hypothetical protein
MTFRAAAIPTVYSGVQFRSRLEARWAAMFDLLKYPWEYEPLDLNGYIPDFVLSFKTPMIVEVKPIVGNPGEWHADKAATDALQKAYDSGWSSEGLLVGATMHTDRWAEGCVSTGEPTNAGLLFDLSPETRRSADGVYASPFGFAACCGGPVDCLGSYSCRKCSHYDGNNDLRDSDSVLALWRKAGNLVQWKAPR